MALASPRQHFVKMYDAALVFGVREHVSHRFQHTKAFVADDELYPTEATPFEPLKEADPAGLILFHPLSCAEDFSVAVFVDSYSNQNSDILVYYGLEFRDNICIRARTAFAATLHRLQYTVPNPAFL